LSRHNAEKFFPAAPKLISRILSNLVVFRANQVIAISEAVKNYLIESKEIRNHSKIKVIYYGFETRGNTSDLIEEKIRDLDNFDFLIGTIARLVPQKDLETLLTAFSIFSNQESSARLVIVGDGYLKESLIEYASKIGIANKVIWLGRVGNVQSVIRKMKVFALTSIYEGFGLVLLEAMAEGVPIAAANNSAIPEVLGEGYEGLFETGNAQMLAKRLFEVSEPKKAQELVKYLNYRMKKFEPNRMRLKIDEIYAELERI
jgi:glycosyltransferase involved in cell wall biosynthesis